MHRKSFELDSFHSIILSDRLRPPFPSIPLDSNITIHKHCSGRAARERAARV